jgi:transketolase
MEKTSMASMADIAGNEAALARQRLLLAEPRGPERTMANAIRALTIDAVEAAKVGHPGMPLGMADVATVLWTKVLKYDSADAKWADRDRFVLSAGHGSMLLYALLHLTGHQGMEIEVLKRFRQLHSAAAGHPDRGAAAGGEIRQKPGRSPDVGDGGRWLFDGRDQP